MADIAERVRSHRERLRGGGLRPIELWVPDTSSAQVRSQLAREAAIVSASDTHDDVLGFFEGATAGWDE
ncbi:MAG: antitoxin MazE family protein [Promicromonosporaceae bacterium]|nr:antitoxin MazE family protein [Promicromonosporaceae bacterium]